MFKRNAGFLAWTAGAILTLGVAAGASAVVPSLINAEETPPAITSASVDAAATVDAPPAEAAVAAEAPAPEVTVPEVIVPEAETVVVKTPTTKAPAPKVVAPVVEAPAPVVAPVVVPAGAGAARPRPPHRPLRGPGAVGHRRHQRPGAAAPLLPDHRRPTSPTSATRCAPPSTRARRSPRSRPSAWPRWPAYVPVSAAAADYAVRTAVSMYCPGYASKLV